MNITQVKIFPVHEDKLKAFVSLVFDHDFMINDIKVIQGRDGLFLSMPSRRKKNGEFKDVAHPLNNRTRRLLEETVLAEYRKVVNDATPRRPDRAPGRPGESSPTAFSGPVPVDSDHASQGSPAVPGKPAAVSPDIQQPTETSRDVVVAANEPGSGEQTLEEVQKRHLSDSYWSVS